MLPKVSVIIPVYGVERFIGRCAETLMQQTLQDVEYIFVDDATPDRSMEVLAKVLAKYPQRAAQVRTLAHSTNKGLPAARNTGLTAASGEYVFHCDSDDYIEPDMLELLYTKATEADADMVWCDWFLSFEKNERYMSQPDYATPMEALKGMLGGRMKYNVWNKLVRRSLYTDHAITFPDGHGMGEDMTMMMLAACAKRVAYVPRALYHYVRLNSEAFTSTMNKKKLPDIQYNVERTGRFLTEMLGDEIVSSLNYFKLNVKFPWLIGPNTEMFRLWRTTFTEADRYIGNNPYMSFRNKALQWAALYQLDFILKAYYYIVYKFIYGIIYR